MMNIVIQDNLQQIKIATEDLQAVRSVILTLEERLEFTHEQEILTVVGRALGPIISDLQEAADTIDGELKNVQQD